jgi:hypothetical protein
MNTLDVQRSGRLVHVHLNRPDVRCAFTKQVIAALSNGRVHGPRTHGVGQRSTTIETSLS